MFDGRVVYHVASGVSIQLAAAVCANRRAGAGRGTTTTAGGAGGRSEMAELAHGRLRHHWSYLYDGNQVVRELRDRSRLSAANPPILPPSEEIALEEHLPSSRALCVGCREKLKVQAVAPRRSRPCWCECVACLFANLSFQAACRYRCLSQRVHTVPRAEIARVRSSDRLAALRPLSHQHIAMVEYYPGPLPSHQRQSLPVAANCG